MPGKYTWTDLGRLWVRNAACLLLMCCLWLSCGVSESFANSSQAATLGVVDLLPHRDTVSKLALVDFHSLQHNQDYSRGVLTLIENRLLAHPGFAKKLELLPYSELLDALRAENKTESVSPLDLPWLTRLIATDCLIFVDERFNGRDWYWHVRIYSGRSGAFLHAFDVSLHETHMMWTIDEFVEGLLAAVCYKKVPSKPQVRTAIQVLPGSLERLGKIALDCSRERCLQRLPEFKWIHERNPALLQLLLNKPSYITALSNETESPVEMARINLLEDKPIEVSIKLENKLAQVRSREERIRFLSLIGRAAVLQGRREKAEEVYLELKKLSPRHPDLALGFAWLQEAAKNYEEAVRAYQDILRRDPDQLEAAEHLVNVYWEQKNNDAAWQAKVQVAKILWNRGDYLRSNVLWMELIDHAFTVEWLPYLRIELLSSVDRKNLATILNQQGIGKGGNEKEIFYHLARLKLQSGEQEEGGRVLQGVLQMAPDDPALLMLSLEHHLYNLNDLVAAQRILDQMPSRIRPPMMAAYVAEKLNRFAEAERILAKATFDKAFDFEVLLYRGRLLALAGEWKKSLRVFMRAKDVDPTREEVYRQLEEIYRQQKNESEEKQALGMVWSLSGKSMDLSDVSDHVFYSEYNRLILPHPIVHLQGKKVLPLQQVLLLDGMPSPVPATDWEKAMSYLRPYLPRKNQQIYEEVKNALRHRFEVIEDVAIQQELWNRLEETDGEVGRAFTRSQLLELASRARVDAVFAVVSNEMGEESTGIVNINTSLYSFDSDGNTIYGSRVHKQTPYLAIYRFNSNLLASPLIAMLFLLFLYLRFTRMTRHWSKPLEKARFLVKQGNLQKAAMLLEKYGYYEDHLELQGHLYARYGEYQKALEAFYRAKDFENAVLVLRSCPDNEETSNMAAEVFFQLKQFGRAEAYYKKTKNLLGLAKVYQATGQTNRAGRVLGQYYFEANNPQAAIEEYRKISDFERAATVLFYYGKYQPAAGLFRKAGNDQMVRKCMARLKGQKK